jgi:hypothetical protein
MRLLKKGRSTSKRSRHIDIRYFWLADREKNGEILIQYEPTEDMLADVLTKPLQGARFIALRDRLLGKTTMGCYVIC